MGKGMKAGKHKPAGMGGGKQASMQQQVARLQRMQQEMEETQAALNEKEVTTTAGGGAVEVTVTGKKEIKAITIKPEVVDPDDVEMLQDLILVAVNEAMRQVDEMTEAEMGKFTAGMNVPGLF